MPVGYTIRVAVWASWGNECSGQVDMSCRREVSPVANLILTVNPDRLLLLLLGIVGGVLHTPAVVQEA